MIWILLVLFKVIAGNNEIVSFASKFDIEFDKACPSVNLALKTLTKITINCELYETSKLIGCIKESVSYLIENIFKIQKCLKHKSYYEFSSLINNFNEECTCIIFHTTIHLNDYLKSVVSNEINQEIELKQEIHQQFDDSCSVQSFKIGKKISIIISTSFNFSKINQIVTKWAHFFNNPELNSNNLLELDENPINNQEPNSESFSSKDPILQNTDQNSNHKESNLNNSKASTENELINLILQKVGDELKDKILKELEEKTEKKTEEKTEKKSEEKFEKKTGKNNSSPPNDRNKKYEDSAFDSFWKEICCFISKYPSLDFIKIFLLGQCNEEKLAVYQCSNYTYDTNEIFMRIMWLKLQPKNSLTEEMLRWAFKKVSSSEYDTKFYGYLQSAGNYVKDGLNRAYKVADFGIKVSEDSIKNILNSIKNIF